MTVPARTLEERKRDTLHRLAYDVDAWVATADAVSGIPYLVPLSFLWEGTTLLIATQPPARPAATCKPAGRSGSASARRAT